MPASPLSSQPPSPEASQRLDDVPPSGLANGMANPGELRLGSCVCCRVLIRCSTAASRYCDRLHTPLSSTTDVCTGRSVKRSRLRGHNSTVTAQDGQWQPTTGINC